jgi:hypothetical protein
VGHPYSSILTHILRTYELLILHRTLLTDAIRDPQVHSFLFSDKFLTDFLFVGELGRRPTPTKDRSSIYQFASSFESPNTLIPYPHFSPKVEVYQQFAYFIPLACPITCDCLQYFASRNPSVITSRNQTRLSRRTN